MFLGSQSFWCELSRDFPSGICEYFTFSSLCIISKCLALWSELNIYLYIERATFSREFRLRFSAIFVSATCESIDIEM